MAARKNENKTQANDGNVDAFLDAVEPDQRRDDARAVCRMMSEITGEQPVMWGDSIVGFGSYHYRYNTGREGDFLVTGFSPRKTALTLYIMRGFSAYEDLMAKLGKYKTGKSCLYLKKLDDIDEKTLRKLIKQSADWIRKNYPT